MKKNYKGIIFEMVSLDESVVIMSNPTYLEIHDNIADYPFV